MKPWCISIALFGLSVIDANANTVVEPLIAAQSSSSTQTAVGNDPLLNQDPDAEFIALPFIFSTETLSTAMGAAAVIKHAGQPQAAALGIGLYSSNDSWIGFLGLYNYQIPTIEQWLFSFETYQGHYEQGIYFLDANETPSSQPEKTISEGDKGFSRLHFKYILPFATGANGAKQALLDRRDDISWNPLVSGVSSIKITPYTQHRKLAVNDQLADKARGVELKFEWDNRDAQNDSKEGGKTSVKIKHGLAIDDDPHWTLWEFEQSLFYNLGGNSWFDEQVVAANVFVADTPTWNDYENATQDYRRPPSFAGVYLGGYDRSRGYSSKSFTGRSAVNYTLEYRIKPQWQPLQNWPIFNLYHIPWWQWVMFAEVGKVANEFDAQALHTDMHHTFGVGVRFEVENIVVRTELAFGSEDSEFWVMVNQPF
ncbi:BamA/TamA family outer membrane protein [Shewanella subflava]|uniref:Bacterial surface antigen (D15) domain-containing protein n=1 Tax=Shewanella subflava TaxID=2986476 RepID=A0ABT3I5N8_9GAMM|nr:hypothetical protein [Shewanella subflava]MCW3171381.1 hypothetical protein [Shewanella subflava]